MKMKCALFVNVGIVTHDGHTINVCYPPFSCVTRPLGGGEPSRQPSYILTVCVDSIW